MKRCPECRRDYYDDTLLYCLDDGNALLEGPATASTGDEPATAIFHTTDVGGDAPTRAQIHTTEQTAVLPSGISDLPKRRFDKRLIAAPFLLGMIVLGGFFGYRYFKPAASEQINSIAVLPFENRSGSTDTDYLSDGLADSLIYRLSQLPNLKVSPTSSVMRYKGKETDVAQIAKELEVDAVMSGRLVQRGDDLSISVQLIDSRTKKLIWAEQYDRKMSDLLTTQREIATTIAQKLELKFSGNDDRGITKKYTSSNDSYQLYLKARYHFAKRTKVGMLQAADHYEQAIMLDPNYALAYARLAEVYLNLPTYPYMSPDQALPKAKSAINRALLIDPMLSEAHTFNGFYLAAYEWKWAEAEAEFKRALELDPSSPAAHLRYGQLFLGPAGRFEEAIAELETAYEMEPLDIVTGDIYAWTHLWAGQKERGLELAKKTYELDPDHPFARFLMAVALNINGHHSEAIEICENALKSDPTDQFMLQQTGIAYARTGATPKAQQIIRRFTELGNTGYVGPYSVVTVYAAMGERDAAIAELDKAYRVHDFFLSRLKVDPFMDPLRDDSRFKDLLRRINLPE